MLARVCRWVLAAFVVLLLAVVGIQLLVTVAVPVILPLSLIGLLIPASVVVVASEAFNLTPEFVVSVVTSAIALALEVVPGLKERWAKLPAEAKRFAWLVGCVLVGVAPWAVGCVGRAMGLDLSAFAIAGSCEADTFARGMQVAFMAYFASQSVHGLSVAGAKAVTYFRKRSK